MGYGPLYQGRFKSFQVQCDDHLLSLLRYVERDPLSAGLVERSELWRWSSLGSRADGDKAVKALLPPWPVEARELDGSRQLSSNREGIRSSAGEHRQRMSLPRGQLGDANCKPTGLAAHGSSGRPAPQSEPSCGRRGELAPGKCWQRQTQENRKPSRSRFRRPLTSCVLVSVLWLSHLWMLQGPSRPRELFPGPAV